MDLMKLGKELLGEKLGEGAGGVMDGLAKLTGGGEGALDLGELVQTLQNGGLANQVSSWLGDGANTAVSGEQMMSALGENRVGEMASAMGVNSSTAIERLQDVLPSLLDRASSGGSLDGQYQGATNALELAKSLLI